ncbi:type II toxin-antitoxin system VapC family toxin [Sphingomonas canadensis]|uniref:Type II toxin-antitoxin system VapC family toxin n=1 Tax=Sphingomonas canadensis TaxID=1219257 RepID=A0ABW3HCZ2_9SPHN|nr:type II toxin-antitoxin system VapC family toxin [Sphingomonas canadensis]MCW3838386.1 type II toxin-antitoxin system VapC family toxin [Sphingomonas canadensis]
MIFVDASALVAILAGEAERPALISALDGDSERLWSAMSCWEAVASLRRSYGMDVVTARREVESGARLMGLELVPIGPEELTCALDAYQRFGKGSGHAARLNMGDCFAYACATTNDARLLYKGDDFARTDIA